MNTFGIGATVTIYTKGLQQTLQNFPTRGFQSCVEPVLNFGLDSIYTIDSMVVVWPDLAMQRIYNISADKKMTLRQSDAKGKFKRPANKPVPLFSNVTNKTVHGNVMHRENQFIDFDRERLIPHLLSTEGPKTAVADINGDGLEDFVIGAAKHDTAKVFLQTSTGHFTQLAPQPAFQQDADFEDAGMAFLDVDNDGDSDLVIASGGNLDMEGSALLQPRLYINNGKGIFERDNKRLPSLSVNASCIKILDFNGDGNPDLFIGGRSVPGQYGVIPQSYLLLNDHGVFKDVTAESAPGLQMPGMVTDAVWADIDNDGKKELVVVGEWMPVTVFKNENGHLKLSETLNKQFVFTEGWWNCIQAVDLNNDGRLDLIAGNLGLNTKIKADSLHPARVYINDFDKNGIEECVLTYYKSDGKSYPYYQKNDLTAQIPALRKKFLKHSVYAGKTIGDIFDRDQLQSAVVKNAFEFRSCAFINRGNGMFEKQPLPKEAQFSPVYAILVDDFDEDGRQDILLAGNFFGLKPELGRYDASYGVFYHGLPNGEWRYGSPENSGFFYKGEARDLGRIKSIAGQKLILLARNNDSLLLFKQSEQKMQNKN